MSLDCLAEATYWGKPGYMPWPKKFERMISGDTKDEYQTFPSSYLKHKCEKIFLGKMFLVSAQRNAWDGNYSSLFSGASAFHTTFLDARDFVESRRTRGTSWTIREVPSIVVSNKKCSAILVCSQNISVPELKEVPTPRGRSLESFINSWIPEALKLFRYPYILLHTTEYRCGCDENSEDWREKESSRCWRCGDSLTKKTNPRWELEPAELPFLSSAISRVEGDGWRLSYFGNDEPQDLDLEPVFSYIGRLTTHLFQSK